MVSQKAGKIPKYNFSLHNVFNDGISYLIGMAIVVLLVYTVIQIHKYFSKDNKPIKVPKTQPLQQQQQQQPLSNTR